MLNVFLLSAAVPGKKYLARTNDLAYFGGTVHGELKKKLFRIYFLFPKKCFASKWGKRFIVQNF
jgi:hypothetical protein